LVLPFTAGLSTESLFAWIAPFFKGKMETEAVAKGYGLPGQRRPPDGSNRLSGTPFVGKPWDVGTTSTIFTFVGCAWRKIRREPYSDFSLLLKNCRTAGLAWFDTTYRFPRPDDARHTVEPRSGSNQQCISVHRNHDRKTYLSFLIS
jgi:hypothetical protein